MTAASNSPVRTVTSRFGDETGSMLPLLAFFTALTLVVIFVVAAATSLYLERERLFTVADGAALAGAEAFSLADAHLDDGGVTPAITDASVTAAVDGYLAALPPESTASGLDGVSLVRAGAVGSTARVTVAARWRPPVLSLILPRGLRLTVTSSARAAFG